MLFNKVLYVATANPFINGGGSQATRAFLDSILDMYGKEHVHVMISSEDLASVLPDYSDVEYVPVDKPSIIQILYNYLFGRIHRFCLPLYKSLARENYDLCVINGSLTAGWVLKKLSKGDTKIVVIHHNLEVEYHKGNKTRVSLFGYFCRYIAWNEKEAYKRAAVNFFLTKQDQCYMESHYGVPEGKNYWLGCYEYKAAKKIIPRIKTDPLYSMVISGSLCDAQTLHGLKDFYIHYLKCAIDLIPNLKILVTGRSYNNEVVSLLGESEFFKIVENPKDIYNYVSQGLIYLCPTDVGGGIKLRVMDGLKCGRPVLVHSVSARGYEQYADAPFFRIYFDETTFKHGLLSLVEYLVKCNNGASNEIINAYYKYFSYQSGLQRMKTILMTL